MNLSSSKDFNYKNNPSINNALLHEQGRALEQNQNNVKEQTHPHHPSSTMLSQLLEAIEKEPNLPINTTATNSFSVKSREHRTSLLTPIRNTENLISPPSSNDKRSNGLVLPSISNIMSSSPTTAESRHMYKNIHNASINEKHDMMMMVTPNAKSLSLGKFPPVSQNEQGFFISSRLNSPLSSNSPNYPTFQRPSAYSPYHDKLRHHHHHPHHPHSHPHPHSHAHAHSHSTSSSNESNEAIKKGLIKYPSSTMRPSMHYAFPTTARQQESIELSKFLLKRNGYIGHGEDKVVPSPQGPSPSPYPPSLINSNGNNNNNSNINGNGNGNGYLPSNLHFVNHYLKTPSPMSSSSNRAMMAAGGAHELEERSYKIMSLSNNGVNSQSDVKTPVKTETTISSSQLDSHFSTSKSNDDSSDDDDSEDENICDQNISKLLLDKKNDDIYSHTHAERLRRKEMKGLFEKLRVLLPSVTSMRNREKCPDGSSGKKYSKWEILNGASNAIDSLFRKQHALMAKKSMIVSKIDTKCTPMSITMGGGGQPIPSHSLSYEQKKALSIKDSSLPSSDMCYA